jgi:phage replication O-like protein O
MSIESPQLEDGFTPIANAIMDALARTRFSGYERSVLDFLFRKTYGWSKKSDLIALSLFVDATKIAKPNIVHTINRLIERNVISVVKSDNGSLTRYEFNKHWGEWKSLSKSTTLLKSTTTPLLKSTPTISIEDTTSIVHIVGNPKKQRKFKIPHLIFDTETLQLSGIDDEARRAFAAACPKADLNDCLERLKAWIIKKGIVYENYWRTLCTIGGGDQTKGGINGHRQAKGYRPDIKDAVFTGENWIRSEHEHDADPTD